MYLQYLLLTKIDFSLPEGMDRLVRMWNPYVPRYLPFSFKIDNLYSTLYVQIGSLAKKLTFHRRMFVCIFLLINMSSSFSYQATKMLVLNHRNIRTYLHFSEMSSSIHLNFSQPHDVKKKKFYKECLCSLAPGHPEYFS